jgi:hypothetical protein
MGIFKLLKDSVVEISNEYYYRFMKRSGQIGLRMVAKEKEKGSGAQGNRDFCGRILPQLLSKSFWC